MHSSRQEYFRKSAVTPYLLPLGLCSPVFFLYLLSPSQCDPSQVFPERLTFMPKTLLAFSANSLVPAPDSRMNCAMESDARTPLRLWSSVKIGPSVLMTSARDIYLKSHA